MEQCAIYIYQYQSFFKNKTYHMKIILEGILHALPTFLPRFIIIRLCCFLEKISIPILSVF